MPACSPPPRAAGSRCHDRHDHCGHPQRRRDPGSRRRVARSRAPRAREWQPRPGGSTSRVAFAAAHVVADPRGENVPGAPAVVDWDATLAFRRAPVLVRLRRRRGDGHRPAQHGPGLARRAGAGPAQCGAGPRARGPDRVRRGHRPRHRARSLADVRDAYLEQVAFVESCGSQVIVMASRHLAALRRQPRRLPRGVRRRARPGARARHPALAGRGVRPAAARLLGQHRRRRRHRDVPGPGPRARRQGRRGQGLAALRRRTRSGCAPRCRRACGSTPATTSTTPS